MKDGWYQDDYLVLFSPNEADTASAQYAVARWLPAHRVVGLRSWDDLLVQDHSGLVFSVPSVPIVGEHMEPFALPPPNAALVADSRLSGKVKWYLQPLVFGGHPTDEANISWVTLEQHAQLVVFWNDRYQELKASSVGA